METHILAALRQPCHAAATGAVSVYKIICIGSLGAHSYQVRANPPSNELGNLFIASTAVVNAMRAIQSEFRFDFVNLIPDSARNNNYVDIIFLCKS